MKEVNEEHDHVHFEIIICSVALRKKKKKYDGVFSRHHHVKILTQKLKHTHIVNVLCVT